MIRATGVQHKFRQAILVTKHPITHPATHPTNDVTNHRAGQWTHRPPYPWVWLIALLLLGAWIGARGLNADTIWFDEYYSIYESGGASYGPLHPLDLWFRVATFSSWPPGYNATLAAWGAVTGWDQVTARGLSLLFGVLSVATLYRLGRDLHPATALMAAALFGSSAFYLNYFHELRGYTLHVWLACLCALLYWKRANRYLLMLALAALLYSHPVGQLAVAVLFAYHLLLAPRDAQWRKMLFAFVSAGILYLPWLGMLALDIGYEVGHPRDLQLSVILPTAAAVYTNWLPLPGAILAARAVLAIRRRSVGFAAFWLIGLLALVLVVNAVIPFLFHIRLLLALLPALALLMAAGSARLPRSVANGFCAVWIGLGVYLSFTPSFIRTLPGAWPTLDWQAFSRVKETLETRATEADAAVFYLAPANLENWFNATLQYYLSDVPARYSLISIVDEIAPATDEDEGETAEGAGIAARLARFIDDAPVVWVAIDPTLPPTADMAHLLDLLAAHEDCGSAVNLPAMRLDVYAASTCPAL